MMKFFRKYTKHLLAVFMALLLLVWLAGDALRSILKPQYNPSKVPAGQAYGRTIYLREMQESYAEANVLEGVITWPVPWGYVLRELGVTHREMLEYFAKQVRGTPLTKEEWYMLDSAARRSRVHVPLEAVDRFKTKSNIDANLLNYIRTQHKVSLDAIDEAIQSFLRVQEAALLAANAVKISEPDIQDLVRQTSEKASTVAVVVEAKPFIDASYPPTEEELKAQFEKYKNVASQPANSPEFGYELPQTAQLEYIEVSVEALAKRQKVSEDEAYKYWLVNKTQFMQPVTPPATTQPATQPETPKPYTTFTDAHDKVMEKLHKDRAKAEATRIARDILEPLKQPWLSAATTQPHNVKQPPASETTADVYPKLIDKLQAKHPGVLKYGRTQLLDQSGLIDDPALGTASAAGAEGQLSLSEAAFLVPGTDAKLDGNPNQQRFVRNLYETAAEPFVTPGGNAYVVRTVAVRARKAPEMDAIRQRLIDDVRRARAYQEAERQARALAEKAGQVGVEKALEADATLMTKLGKDALKKSEPFPRQQSYGMELYPASVPGLGFDNELVKNIFTLAGKTTTQPVNVLVHEQKPQQRWLVVQLLEIQPVTQAEYDQQRTRALMTLRIQRQIEVLSNWFNPQQIRDRINWKDAEKPAPKEAEKDESA